MRMQAVAATTCDGDSAARSGSRDAWRLALNRADQAAGQDPIVVFDGTCVLCSRCVAFLLPRAPRLRFATMQSNTGAALMRSHGLDPDDPDSLLLLHVGQAWTNSDAFAQLGRFMCWPWRLLTLLRWCPRPLRDAIYRYVARNRYRWFGRQDHCQLPDGANRARFIDV